MHTRKFAEVGINLAVVAVAMVAGVMPAIGVGLLLAVVIFTVSMSRSPVRRIIRNPAGRSRVRRSPAQELLLRQAGEEISLIELEGAVFFGTSERILDHVDAERVSGAKIIVMDLSRVTHVDISGGKRLLELCDRTDVRVFLSPLHETNSVYAELQSIGLARQLKQGVVFADIASACEAAENIVLDGQSDSRRSETVLADAFALLQQLGIPASSASILAMMGQEVAFEPGTIVIRAGDPADRLFLLLDGEVQVELPTNRDAIATRLAVLVPGVFFGEAALLGQMRRTANVVARTQARCWQMDAVELGVIKDTSPEIAWAVMTIIGRQLASHVSAANAVIDKLEN